MAPGKHHADPLTDELRFLPEQRNWRYHDVGIDNLIDKPSHHRPLTCYHERIVNRVNRDRLIVTHECA